MRISDWSSDVCSSDLGGGRSLPASMPSLFFGTRLCRRFPSSRHVVTRQGGDFAQGRKLRYPQPFGLQFHQTSRAHGLQRPVHLNRSEERRVGKECVSTFSSGW